MILEQYYLKIRQIHPEETRGVSFEITLQELTDLFECSGRNVNLILRKMEEQQWIEWKPGRGRGNRSQMTFLISRETLVLQIAQELVQKGDIKQAFAYLDEYASLPFVKEQFMYWLDTHFGYSAETKNMDIMETLRIPYDKTIDYVDPAFMYYAVESHLIKQVFDCLVRTNPDDNRIVPHLAHHWTNNEAATEWCFYIRKGVYYHHGRELTAHDVKFTLERLQDDQVKSPFGWMVQNISRVEVVNNYVVRIYLFETNHLFLKYLSFDAASIVPWDAVKEMGDRFSKSPIGTGPFKLMKNDDNMVVLEAYPRYFDKRAHLDRIEIWITPEMNSTTLVTETDSYQMRNYICGDKSIAAPAEWEEIETSAIACHFLSYNLSHQGPQQNKLFRKALFHGLDRKKLIERTGSTSAEPANSFFSTSNVGLDELSYDLTLARRLLAESGYKQEKVKFFIGKANESTEWFLEQCELLGVQIEIIEKTKDEVDRLTRIKRADISIGTIVTEDESDFSLVELFLSENSCFYKHMSPEHQSQVERIVKEVYREPSSANRLQIALELEQMLKADEAVLFLYHRHPKAQVHPSLKGVYINSLGWVDFRKVWFEPVAIKEQEEGEMIC